MISVLEWIVSISFFLHKLTLFPDSKEKHPWILGSIGCVSAMTYFYLLKDLPVYVIMEAGALVLMIYGWIVRTEKESTKWVIRGFTLLFMTAAAIGAFKGQLTFFEFVSSVTFLVGTYYLHPLRSFWERKWGWVLYVLAHGFAMQVGFLKGQETFMDFQIASMLLSIVAVFRGLKKHGSALNEKDCTMGKNTVSS